MAKRYKSIIMSIASESSLLYRTRSVFFQFVFQRNTETKTHGPYSLKVFLLSCNMTFFLQMCKRYLLLVFIK